MLIFTSIIDLLLPPAKTSFNFHAMVKLSSYLKQSALNLTVYSFEYQMVWHCIEALPL